MGRCYEKEFPVDMKKIEFWKQETEMFLKLTEEICLDKIEGFREFAKSFS